MKYFYNAVAVAAVFFLSFTIALAATTVPWTKNGATEYPSYIADLIGIGTTTPFSTLQVAGSSIATGFDGGQLTLSDTNAGTNLKHWTFASEGGNFYLSTTSDSYATTSVPQLAILGSSGFIGIGLTNPSTPLEISRSSSGGTSAPLGIINNNTVTNSAVQFDLFLGGALASVQAKRTNINASTDVDLIFNTQTNNTVFAAETIKSYGSTGINGTTTPWGILSVNASSTLQTPAGSPMFVVGSTTSTQFVVASNGFVGIGTSTPYKLLSVAGNEVVTGTVQWPALAVPAGSFLAVDPSGFVIATTAPSGGAGTNYFTNSGASTYLSTGTNLGVGTTTPYTTLGIDGGSGSGIPTVVIGGITPSLQIGSSSPGYGWLANDRLNTIDNRNDYSASNVYNLSPGNCATADVTEANNLNSTALNFNDMGHTSSGFTGVGCANNPFTGFGANSSYYFDPSGNMNFALGSTSVASFNWFTGGYAAANQQMTLSNSGKLGVGTTSPYATLSVEKDMGGTGGNTLFVVSSSTNGTATSTLFQINNASATSPAGIINTSVGVINCTASCNIDEASSVKIQILSNAINFGTSATTNVAHFLFTGTADTALTAAINVPVMNWNFAQLRTHATGAINEQDDILYTPSIHTFATGISAASVISTTSALTIAGMPTVGARGSFTNDYGILVQATTSLTSASTTNSYGLGVFASSGAGNNYAAVLAGRVLIPGMGTGAGSGSVCYNPATGEVLYDSGANCILSSQRFKDNIASITPQNSLATILKLNPVTFNYKKGYGDSGKAQWEGFIAEQVNTVDKDLVQVDARGLPYSVYYQNITAKLVGAVQAISSHQSEQDAEIAELQSEVKALQDSQQMDICRI